MNSSREVYTELQRIFKQCKKIKPEAIKFGDILVSGSGFSPVSEFKKSLMPVTRVLATPRDKNRCFSGDIEINLRHDFKIISEKMAEKVERLLEEYHELLDKEKVSEMSERAARRKLAARDVDRFILWNDLGNGFVLEVFNGYGKLLERTRLVDEAQEAIGGGGNGWNEIERMVKAYAASHWDRDAIKDGAQYIVIQVPEMD